MNNHYVKFEYKGKKHVEVTDYKKNPDTPYAFRMGKCLSSTPVKIRIYSSNVHKLRGAYFQCVNIHYVKFEY